MLFNAMNFYTSNKELIMIPVKAFNRNPKCILSKDTKGKFEKVATSLKNGATFKVRKRNGEVYIEKNLNSITNIVGVEFQMERSRHYFTVGNSTVKITETPENSIISVLAK